MSRFQVGDIVTVNGRPARVVWLRENANEIEAMDEYIVEFEDKQRRFVLSSALDLKDSEQTHSIHDRKSYSDSRHSQTH
jgi:hypothetical protein